MRAIIIHIAVGQMEGANIYITRLLPGLRAVFPWSARLQLFYQNYYILMIGACFDLFLSSKINMADLFFPRFSQSY